MRLDPHPLPDPPLKGEGTKPPPYGKERPSWFDKRTLKGYERLQSSETGFAAVLPFPEYEVCRLPSPLSWDFVVSLSNHEVQPT